MSGAGSALRVEDASEVAPVRRAALRLADQLGFSEARAGQVALVVTELATNLAKHARGGQVLLRSIQGASEEGAIEILSIDRGPGIPDVARSQRDGYSTAGTRGEGLGAIARQANLLQIHSEPSGTIVLARVERDPDRSNRSLPRLEIGAVRVNAPGETVSGDDWAAHVRDERLVATVVDGLGHGLAAHDAAREALAAFERAHEEHATAIVEAMHEALRGTRGAAVAVLVGDLEHGAATFCGLGNISGVIITAGGDRHRLVSHNGTAGLGRPRIVDFHYPLPPDAILVMHSDGISPQWDLAAYAGLRSRHPSVVAAVLFRDFGRQRDDATVIVAKERPHARVNELFSRSQ